jgi:hypothetical protein
VRAARPSSRRARAARRVRLRLQRPRGQQDHPRQAVPRAVRSGQRVPRRGTGTRNTSRSSVASRPVRMTTKWTDRRARSTRCCSSRHRGSRTARGDHQDHRQEGRDVSAGVVARGEPSGQREWAASRPRRSRIARGWRVTEARSSGRACARFSTRSTGTTNDRTTARRRCVITSKGIGNGTRSLTEAFAFRRILSYQGKLYGNKRDFYKALGYKRVLTAETSCARSTNATPSPIAS